MMFLSVDVWHLELIQFVVASSVAGVSFLL